MIRHNKVSGGMVLKLEACKRALAAGVKQVRIVGGRTKAGCFLRRTGRKGRGRASHPVTLLQRSWKLNRLGKPKPAKHSVSPEQAMRLRDDT